MRAVFLLLAACGSAPPPATTVSNTAPSIDAPVASARCDHVEGFIEVPSTGAALADALVVASGGPAAGEVSTRTDAEGHFTLPYREDIAITVSAPGVQEVLAISPERCDVGTLYAGLRGMGID